MSTPSEVLNRCWASTFGCAEFESLAKNIVEFYSSDRRSGYSNMLGMRLGGYDDGDGWKKRFTISDIKTDPSMFAAFCCAGWVSHVWFPKGAFIVSDAFIERVSEEECRGCKGSRVTFDKCTAR